MMQVSDKFSFRGSSALYHRPARYDGNEFREGITWISPVYESNERRKSTTNDSTLSILSQKDELLYCTDDRGVNSGRAGFKTMEIF